MNRPLTYNIVEQRLSGYIGTVEINCAAGSGGRAGTKTKGAENWWLKNNALRLPWRAGDSPDRGSAQRFDVFHHPRAHGRVRQTPDAGAQIVDHVRRIAGARNQCRHRRGSE